MDKLEQPTQGMWKTIGAVAVVAAHNNPMTALVLVCLTALAIVFIILAFFFGMQKRKIDADVEKHAMDRIVESELPTVQKAHFINLLLTGIGRKKK
ncbi:hypothetical protein NKW53_05740 [Acetobacter orientalis]|uniref:hypothetical protein n=1 Tax=Acetobacter orientalis TaxID=146474 RepID=UPI00209CA162|nr:hypothetical protein [Acetobacter orientalis]MCP1215567.1 hypothetical protein [Acetobacter orientalis]MCP1217580.1 hypothetical protein [Acetobacter orientalis]